MTSWSICSVFHLMKLNVYKSVFFTFRELYSNVILKVTGYYTWNSDTESPTYTPLLSS